MQSLKIETAHAVLLLHESLYSVHVCTAISVWVPIQFVEHSNRRKMKSYSMRRKNSISAINFIWLYFVAISIFVVWLGRFAPFAK